jgi:hypothetical protein
MPALIVSLVLFFSALVAHVLWWKVRVPRHQTRGLLIVFGLIPVFGSVVWLVTGGRPALAMGDLMGIALFYGGAMCCYLVVYAGVEEVSPSLTIIRALERAGPRGCTRSELASEITEERFIRPRLDALRRDGLIEVVPGGCRLTQPGLRVAELATALACAFGIHESA